MPWRRAWQPTPVFLPGEDLWTEEPGGLQSMGSQRVRRDWVTKHMTLYPPLLYHTESFHCPKKLYSSLSLPPQKTLAITDILPVSINIHFTECHIVEIIPFQIGFFHLEYVFKALPSLFHGLTREIEVTWRRRGGIKRGESNLASNEFPMCSPQSGTFREVHRVTQRREEGGRR